jgi:cytochrome P450
VAVAAMSRARRRDRRVYLRSHPVLFALLALTRRRPVRRLGDTVLVHGTDAYREALTTLPLDRHAAGTTGAAARALGAGEVLFDQRGPEHRAARRQVAADLGAAGVARLRPVWQAVLDRRLARLAGGATVDMVDVAAELAGATIHALLDLPSTIDSSELARAARDAAAAGAREHLPGLRRRRGAVAGRAAASRLVTLLGGPDRSRDAMIAVAGIATTVAGLPRAVAWCADDRLWAAAASAEQRGVLVGELLRVTAPSPLLPRVAAVDGVVAGSPVRAGQRLLLVARHAARAHHADPDATHPVPPQVAQLVFGAGRHACPGAPLARAQLDDTLRLLEPLRPVVVAARADRASALPGWARLMIRAEVR